ncbi:hypothetical protein B0H13DRAFT_1873879 [Mycena leptocephala]|nr:hypothetical protein B0H13DRAFT_1873879 [Mycena leptocephala]
MDEPLRRARVRVPVRRRAEVLARWRDGAGVAREEGAQRGGRGGVECGCRRRGGGGEERRRQRAWMEERGVRRGRAAEDEGRVSGLRQRRFQSGDASPLRSVTGAVHVSTCAIGLRALERVGCLCLRTDAARRKGRGREGPQGAEQVLAEKRVTSVRESARRTDRRREGWSLWRFQPITSRTQRIQSPYAHIHRGRRRRRFEYPPSPSDGPGMVYGLRVKHPDGTVVLKVGRSIEPEHRTAQWECQCWKDDIELLWAIPTKYATKLVFQGQNGLDDP